MKLCKDCKWSSNPGEFAKCEYPGNLKRNRAIELTGFEYGYTERRWIFCETMRRVPIVIDIISEQCGSRGRWWEPKS